MNSFNDGTASRGLGFDFLPDFLDLSMLGVRDLLRARATVRVIIVLPPFIEEGMICDAFVSRMYLFFLSLLMIM